MSMLTNISVVAVTRSSGKRGAATVSRRRFKVGDEVFLKTVKASDLMTAEQRLQHIRRVVGILDGRNPKRVVLNTEANHSRIWKHSDLAPASV